MRFFKRTPAKVKYSPMATEVLNTYLSLPEAHRPAIDLPSILQALDVKYGSDAEYHLFYNDGVVSYRSSVLQCRCVYDEEFGEYTLNTACRMPEYAELHRAILAVQFELSSRERALQVRAREDAVAGVADRDAIALATAALRSERDLVRAVNDEVFG